MRYADQQDSLAGLEAARRGGLPRGRRRWTGSLSQRAQASRRLPQAVFKISSYSHSGGAVWDRVNYVSRAGELEPEAPNGETLNQVELEQMVAEWTEETGERAGRRYAMSAVVSFPKGVDEAKATEAGRQFFREAFADNHDYVFAAHTDATHFHLHVVVQAAGHDGKQIRLNRADLQDLRLLLAEKAREQGIELDASPRWARGLEAERGPSRKVEGMMRRWKSPEQALAGAWFLSAARRTQLEALVEVRGGADPDAAGVTPLEYARAAERLVSLARGQEPGAEKVQTMKAAVELARLGLTLTGRAEREEHFNAAESAAVLAVATQVDKAINAHISELAEDPAARRAALSVRRALAEQLAARRPTPERRWAREGEGQRADAPAVAVQALEYARSAAGVAGSIHTLTHDHDRAAAVQGAVSLARFGWELAERATAPPSAREEAREIIDKAERALRFAINRIEDPQAKREAIQARQTLYRDGVKEYREQRREAERQRRQETEREDGEGRGR